ncbi:MAG: F0F1 ATP synthase subunit B [Paracoccaceae bacterium]
MRILLTAVLTAFASPALAAGDTFVSLSNTDFVVLIAFLIFLGILAYFKVPSKVGEMLDKRAGGIQSELDEARSLREEAQKLLASYERKQKEVQEQADRIVANAKEEAQTAADTAKSEIERSVERRLAGAEDQIASARAAAIKDIRDQAIAVATAAAAEVLSKQMDAQQSNALIDSSIDEVFKHIVHGNGNT